MDSQIKEKGFSLIELLVVIAILGIVVGIGAFQTRDAMRGYRVKAAIDAFYGGFGDSKGRASLKNKRFSFDYDSGNMTADFFEGVKPNRRLFSRVQLSADHLDPGPPPGDLKYIFGPYTVMTATTSDGLLTVTGADIDGDGAVTAADAVPIVNPAAVNNMDIKINPNGTFSDKNNQDAFAFVFQNQTDITEGYAGIDRNYAVVLVRTGLVVKLQRNADGTWQLM